MTDTTISQAEVETMIEKLTSMFDHIRNTFINASQLAQTVNELQAQVNQLKQDVEQTQHANRALNEAVQSLTSQRDEAQAVARNWNERHDSILAQHSQLQNEHAALQYNYDTAKHDLENMKRDRDEGWNEVQRLDKENEQLKARLKEVQRWIDNMKAASLGEQTRDEAGRFEDKPAAVSSF